MKGSILLGALPKSLFSVVLLTTLVASLANRSMAQLQSVGNREGRAPAPASAEENSARGNRSAAKDITPWMRSIDLLPMRFRGLSGVRSMDGAWHLTIDFFDEDRLLVTFETADLVRRLPSCPKTHDDRIVHAVVFDIQSGLPLRQTEWYLHDQQRYLWPLASAQMLLRRGEDFFQLDRDLNESPLLHFPHLAWTSVTPDGKQVIAEAKVDATRVADGEKIPAQNYQLSFIDVATHSVLKTLTLNRLVPVDATSEGNADVVLRNGWIWLVRFAAVEGKPVAVTRLRSVCPPELSYSGEKSMLIGRCTAAQNRYVVSSFTTAGQFLWRQRFAEQNKMPVVTRSASGVRFAFSTILPAASEPDSASAEETAKPQIQRIAVFDSATGTALRELQTEPAITVGDNVALSPNGTLVALLHNAQVQIYRLPEPTKEEQAALAAVQAGTPGLVAPVRSVDPAAELDSQVDDDAPGALAAGTLPGVGSERLPGTPPTSPVDDPGYGTIGNTSTNSAITFRARSRAVAEDVIVTDGKGKPVTGLKKSDFLVTEDGQPQDVRYFEEHSLNASLQSPLPAFKRSSNVFSNVTSDVQADSSTLILLDTLNTPAADQARARDALIRYVKAKPKAESFALCVLSATLQMVRGFTTDENELLLSLRGKHIKPSAVLVAQQADDQSLATLRNLAHAMQNPLDLSHSIGVNLAGMEQSIQNAKLSQDDLRLYMTVDAFDQLARYLSGIPGRKNVLWLSAAFPLAQLPSTSSLAEGPFQNQKTFLPRVRQTLNLLASAHVSVYPVDVRGVSTNSNFGANTTMRFDENLPSSPLTTPSGTSSNASSSADLNLANDHEAPAPGFMNQNLEDFSKRYAEHSAMDVIAEQTGGQAFYGGNDIADAIRKVVQAGSNYYMLSYTPTDRKYDGQFRKIHVKVAGRGYHLAYRTGYYAENPIQPSDKTEFLLRNASVAGMLHGTPESRQIPFEVHVARVGEPKKVSSPEGNVPKPEKVSKSAAGLVKVQHYVLDFAISASQLHFETNPAGLAHGSFRVLANSFDSDGRYMSQGASTASADLRPDDYQQALTAGFRIRQEMDVPADASFLRLGVQDLASANIGTLELPLPVPEAKEDPLARREHELPPVEPD